MPSLDDLIALVEGAGSKTAIDAGTRKQYEEAKFLKDAEGKQLSRMERSNGLKPGALARFDRRGAQQAIADARTSKHDAENEQLMKVFGTHDRALVNKLEGKGQFRDPTSQTKMAFSNPDQLSSEADEVESLFFPKGKAYTSMSNSARDRASKGVDDLRTMIESSPKSADVTARNAATALEHDFEGKRTDDVEKTLQTDLMTGKRSAGEAATIRQALKPRAALEEEEWIANNRGAYEGIAKGADVDTAANEVLAPLQNATDLSLTEVRARKRLATELRKRGVDPLDISGMRDPRALPLRQRTNNPNGPATIVNPGGDPTTPTMDADNALADERDTIEAGDVPAATPTPYQLVTRGRRRRSDVEEFSRMFGQGGA